jgi:hypothetical protein
MMYVTIGRTRSSRGTSRFMIRGCTFFWQWTLLTDHDGTTESELDDWQWRNGRSFGSSAFPTTVHEARAAAANGFKNAPCSPVYTSCRHESSSDLCCCCGSRSVRLSSSPDESSCPSSSCPSKKLPNVDEWSSGGDGGSGGGFLWSTLSCSRMAWSRNTVEGWCCCCCGDGRGLCAAAAAAAG